MISTLSMRKKACAHPLPNWVPSLHAAIITAIRISLYSFGIVEELGVMPFVRRFPRYNGPGDLSGSPHRIPAQTQFQFDARTPWKDSKTVRKPLRRPGTPCPPATL